MQAKGLTELSTEELKKLLQIVYKEQTEFPLNPQRVACIGFQYKQNSILNVFRGLEKSAVQAILVCVLAERLHIEKGHRNT